MSFGFSVGDCLRAALIIKDIVISFSSSRGSAAEYQELLREISNLEHILTLVKELPEDVIGHEEFESIARTSSDCQAVLNKYAVKFQKFRGSLGAGQSNGWIKDAARKVQWGLLMKHEVQTLRAYLSQHVATLNAQLGVESLHVAVTASDLISQSRTSLEHKIADSYKAISAVESRLGVQNDQVQQIEFLVRSFESAVRRDMMPQTRLLASSIAHMMNDNNAHFQHLMSNLQIRQPSPDLHHTWFQSPIRFEDAIGDVIAFARECDFHDLQNLIISRFEPRTEQPPKPGYDKVVAKEYELFDSGESSRLITETNFNEIVPRIGITMAFIVGRLGMDNEITVCPRVSCRSRELTKLSKGGKQCLKCDAWLDLAQKKLPRPHRPLKLRADNPNRLHRTQFNASKRKWNEIDAEPNVISLGRTNSEKRRFKNIRITFTPLAHTPMVKNIRGTLIRSQAQRRSPVVSSSAVTRSSTTLVQSDKQPKPLLGIHDPINYMVGIQTLPTKLKDKQYGAPSKILSGSLPSIKNFCEGSWGCSKSRVLGLEDSVVSAWSQNSVIGSIMGENTVYSTLSDPGADIDFDKQRPTKNPHLLCKDYIFHETLNRLSKHSLFDPSQEEQYFCSEGSCPKNKLCFVELIDLIEHECTVHALHTIKSSYLCPVSTCGARFFREDELQRHLRTIHRFLMLPANKADRNFSRSYCLNFSLIYVCPMEECKQKELLYLCQEAFFTHLRYRHRYDK